MTQEIQVNKDGIKRIALQAKDVVVTVARAARGVDAEIAKQLASDLGQLTGYVNTISVRV